jgi:hypothetical protein
MTSPPFSRADFDFLERHPFYEMASADSIDQHHACRPIPVLPGVQVTRWATDGVEPPAKLRGRRCLVAAVRS